jgi:hypothetical protein
MPVARSTAGTRRMQRRAAKPRRHNVAQTARRKRLKKRRSSAPPRIGNKGEQNVDEHVRRRRLLQLLTKAATKPEGLPSPSGAAHVKSTHLVKKMRNAGDVARRDTRGMQAI